MKNVALTNTTIQTLNYTKKDEKKISFFDVSFAFWMLTEVLFEHTIISTIALLLFGCSFLVDFLNHPTISIKNNSILLFFLIFVAIETVFTLSGNVMFFSNSISMLYTMYINLIFLVICDYYFKKTSLKRIESILILISALASVFAIIQNRLSFGSFSFREHEAGIGFNPNILAYLDSIAIILCIKNKKIDILRKSLLSFIFLVFILLSGTRKSIISLAIFFVFYFLIASSKKRLGNIILVVFLSFILYLVLFYVEPIYNFIGYRFDSLINMVFGGAGGESESTRLLYMEKGILTFKDNLVFGIGLNGFMSLPNIYGHPIGTYSHCNYVELLCDTGIVGTISYYLMHLSVFAFFVKGLYVTKSKDLALYFSIFIGFLAIDVFMVSYFSRLMLMLLLLFMYASKMNFFNQEQRGHIYEQNL